MRQKTVLIITHLDMQKAGNQLLFQTVRGYLAAGYRVVLFTSSPLDNPNRADYAVLLGSYNDKLVVHRFHPLFRPLAKQFIKVKKMKSKTIGLSHRTTIDKEAETKPFGISGGKGVWGLITLMSFTFGGLSEAIKLAQYYNIDLLYGYEIYGAFLGWIVSRLLKVPLVTKFQGTIAFPELQKGKCSAWVRIPHHLLGLRVPADLVIMENDGTHGKEVLQMLGVPQKRIRFWVDGVDKNIYLPNWDKSLLLKRLGIQDDYNIILTLSRLKQWKRVDRAIKAISMVVKKLPNTILLVVGEGEDKEKLENLVKHLKIEDKVVFIGAVPHSDVKYFMNSADIFLSLYDHSNLCNPVLEALVCGKCIITVDDGSTKGVLKNGYNAILINKDSLEDDLPMVIINLLTDKNTKKQIEKNARRYSEIYLYTWEERMRVEINEVEKVLERRAQ